MDESGSETGNVVFKTKLKALIRGKNGTNYTQKVNVVDSKRTPMSGKQLVGNGSVIKVAVEPNTYYMPSSKQVGVSLRLKALQVIDLIEHGVSADSLFDEEDGFVTQAVEKDNSSDYFEDTQDGASEGDF